MLLSWMENPVACIFWGTMAAFCLVCLLLKTCARFLPRDAGREYAHHGALSAGKPRGAGIYFVLAFVLVVLLCLPFDAENVIYLILLVAAMMTGFLDDGAKTPWGEYKKGLLDLAIAVFVALTFLNFNPPQLQIEMLNTTCTLSPVLYGVLTVILVWVSINVTNCSDGVDGLSATQTVITLLTLLAIDLAKQTAVAFRGMIPIFCASLVAYLWFNAHPSRLMMGDAGSRAMGLFIALAVLKTGSPLLYLLVAVMLILDGGLGLVKVSLLRFLKIHILRNIRTPLHDHVRKNKGWSDTQTVTRFAILQLLGCLLALYFVMV